MNARPSDRRARMRAPAGPAKQRGAVLLVAMILLAMMLMLGISAMDGSIIQEKVAANTRDRAAAFESGESATQQALGWLQRMIALGRSQPDNSPGYYMNAWLPAGGVVANVDTGALEFWETAQMSAANSIQNSLPATAQVSTAGRFIVERMRFDEEGEPGSANTSQYSYSSVAVWAGGSNGANVVTQATLVTLQK